MLVPAWRMLAVLVAAQVSSHLLVSLAAASLLRDLPWYWPQLLFQFAFLSSLLLGLAWLAARYQVDPHSLLGSRPRSAVLGRAATLAVPLILLSLGTVFVVFVPLSYFAPEFVRQWLDEPPLLLIHRGHYPVLANALWFLTVVLFGPAAEELFFRGFLFRRLARKWTTASGAVVSSLVFGLVHADILGATCFGIVMVLVYVQSDSLWVPVTAHIANNCGAFLLSFGFELSLGPQEATIEAFRSWWPLGAVGLVLGGGWFVWFVRKHWPVRAGSRRAT